MLQPWNPSIHKSGFKVLGDDLLRRVVDAKIARRDSGLSMAHGKQSTIEPEFIACSKKVQCCQINIDNQDHRDIDPKSAPSFMRNLNLVNVLLAMCSHAEEKSEDSTHGNHFHRRICI